ncbi:MAG TPA: AraC family transcriptional regulator [Tepidisphaeraceae bacterium]|nr:AraC family transcriptional regulator [Tepidisphaeraceae bacterium]
MARRRKTQQQPNRKPPALEPIWSQEPLNRRETYEAPRTLVSEVPILGQISLQRAVPRALGPASHPTEFELHLVHDGRMRLWIDSPKRVCELHGGMASLTQPGQLHSAEGELMLPGRWMWLQFRVPTDARGAMPGLSARETAVLREGLSEVKPPVFHYSPALEDCMERLLGEHRRPTPESPIAARGILHELITWIIRDYRAEQLRRDRAPEGYSPPILKVMEWLNEHLDENISVGDLADVAGLSPSYFRRWFHREVGSSPRDYVTQLRIERAKRLLAESDRSITHIAMDLGYSTSAYFTAVFHGETGTTPSDFRRQLRESREPGPGTDNGRGEDAA